MKSYNSKKPFIIILSLVAFLHLITINISFFNIEKKGMVKGAVIHSVYLKHYGLSQKGKGSGGISKKGEEATDTKTLRKPPPPNHLRTKKKEVEKSQEITDSHEGAEGISAWDAAGSSIAGISIEQIKRAYLDSLRLEIEKHKEYPFGASWRRQTGTVGVSIVILKDGSITGIRLKRPSRHPLLNEAAIKLLSKIKKFRPIPYQLKMERLEVVVNIEYYLTLN